MKTKEEVIEEFRIQSIREAATRVIARKGVAGASMQEIADEAGVAKGTIYLYFRNQQELLEAAIDQALSELGKKLEEALSSEGTFEERLRLLLRSQIEFFANNYDLFQIHVSTKYADDAAPSATRCDRVSRKQYQRFIDRLETFFDEAAANGEIREGDSRRFALFFQEGTAAVLFQRMSEQTPPAIDEEVDWIADTILHGVAKSRRSRRRN